MTRQVHPGSMVAHLWANRSQDSARTGNGNFYFNGATLYSYGRHYVVGFHLPYGGPTLLNSDSYSVSTSGHCSDARRAVSGSFLYVPRLTELRDSVDYKRDKKGVAAVIREYCVSALNKELGLSDESLRGLLAYAGLASSFDKLKRDAAKTIAKAKAARIKADKASAMDILQGWQAIEPELFKHEQAALFRAGDYSSAAHMCEQAAKEIRRAQRTLGKAGTPKRLWESSQRILKALATMPTELEAKRGPASRRARVRGMIMRLRRDRQSVVNLWGEVADTMASGQLSQLSSRLYEYRQTLYAMSRHDSGGLPALIRAKAEAAIEPVESVQHEIALQQTQAQRLEMAERDRLRAQSEADSRAAFFAGEPSNWHGSTESGSCYIRAIGIKRDESGLITGGELQTSHGARVPLVHAIRAFRFVKLVRQPGDSLNDHFVGPVAWQRNGDRVRVGSFELDRVYCDGSFVAGCHKIAWPEIEKLARDLGVFDMSASRDAVTHA